MYQCKQLMGQDEIIELEVIGDAEYDELHLPLLFKMIWNWHQPRLFSRRFSKKNADYSSDFF